MRIAPGLLHVRATEMIQLYKLEFHGVLDGDGFTQAYTEVVTTGSQALLPD